MANPVIQEILRQGRGKPRKHVLAALATGRVESNFKNLPGGDADSQGWRQERASLYKDPRNLTASVKRFYAETAQHDRGQRAGELAADVQRPAAQYRGRYAEHMSEAKKLLRRGGGGGGGATAGTAGTAGRAGLTRVTRTVTPGVSNEAARGQLIASFLSDKGGDPLEFALGIKGLKDIPGSTSIQRSHRPGTPGTRGTRGTRGGGGRQPRKTGGKINELFWNGPGATNIDNDKPVGKGFVSGHTDHVHFAADKSKMRNAARLAKSLGLRVGEYGRGISTGHATNSFHYQPYGAMDVSGDTAAMRKFAQRAARL